MQKNGSAGFRGAVFCIRKRDLEPAVSNPVAALNWLFRNHNCRLRLLCDSCFFWRFALGNIGDCRPGNSHSRDASVAPCDFRRSARLHPPLAAAGSSPPSPCLGRRPKPRKGLSPLTLLRFARHQAACVRPLSRSSSCTSCRCRRGRDRSGRPSSPRAWGPPGRPRAVPARGSSPSPRPPACAPAAR